MKCKFFFYALILGFVFIGQTVQAQLETVDYQIRFNPTNCRWDCYLIIIAGQAETQGQRAQSSGQYSIVVPTGSAVNVAQNFMPLRGNQSYTGTQPLIWQLSTMVEAPAVEPQSDFYAITPTLSPSSFYNNLYPGDTIRLFSLNINPPVHSCGSGIRIFRNGIDPGSDADGMGGGDFSNGMTIGSINQLYRGNAPQVNPPAPVLSAVTTCSSGIEIDLSATATVCMSPLTYSWVGPNGFTATTQDVAINPATFLNNGTYTVTVTNSRNCSSTLSVDALSKPNAGSDQNACQGGSVTLTGSNPTSGTWTALASNPSGATLGGTTNGVVMVDFDNAASGQYFFQYTNLTCSDTVRVTVIEVDAGEDPISVGCFSTGTGTLGAITPGGFWSIDPSSVGSATITDPNNPNSTVTQFTVPGDYYFRWNIGACFDVVHMVVNENCTCVTTNNTLTPVNPATYCGNSGPLLLDGASATPLDGVYSWQYSLNNGVFSNASGTNNQEDYTTPAHTVGFHRYRRIYETEMGTCLDTSNVIQFTVNLIPLAPSNLLVVSSPSCMGQVVNLSVTNTVGATYNWTASSANAGLVTSTTNATTMLPLISGNYTVSVTQTINGCISPAATTIVEVYPTPPTPTLANITSQNPSVCQGNDGSITFSGLIPNTDYFLNYSKNGNVLSIDLLSDISGNLILSNQGAGSYSDFSFTNTLGCSSGVFMGPIILIDPSAPDAPTDLEASPNPACSNSPISLSVTNNPGAVYTWTASSPNAGLNNSTTNTNTMSALVGGFYTVFVTQTVAGCTSEAASLGISVDNSPPAPTAISVSSLNPTTCGGSNGRISISGYTALTVYYVTYSENNVVMTDTITSNASGIINIINLSAGSYTNFSISSFNNCLSSVYPGPVVLSDPSAPLVPANLMAIPNPACLGTIINLSVTAAANTTFNWSASSPNAGLGTSTTNTITMNPTMIGSYTITVSRTVNGCTSPSVNVTVVVNPTPPIITNISGSNPTSCNGIDGFITLSGSQNSTMYTVTYQKNSLPFSVNVTSNESGQIIITGLSSGDYSNFRLVNSSDCSSNVCACNVILTDPNAPLAPINLTANPNPVCAGTQVNLSVTNTPGAIYTWTASSINAGLVESENSSTTMLPNVASSYTVFVTQTFGGCTSTSAFILVVVNNGPATPTSASLTFTNPTICAGSDGTISLSGLVPDALYTLDYTKNNLPEVANLTANNVGVLTLIGLTAGNYSNFRLTNANGCQSGIYTGAVNLSDPNSPAAPANLQALPNPVCLGTSVALSVTNTPGASYTWTQSSALAGLVSTSTNSTTMLATLAGTYTISVVQTIAGCTSPASSVEVVVNDNPPAITLSNIIGQNPITCNGNDGQITLNSLPSNSQFNLQYSRNNIPVNVVVNTNMSGVFIISGLSAGQYTEFILSSAEGCQAVPVPGPINLVDPGAPAAPEGLTAMPNPVCQGFTVNLSVNNTPNATYFWSASSGAAGLVPSTTNNTTMTALSAGLYRISVTQTINNCTSPAAVIEVNVNPLPPTILNANVNGVNPTSCSGNDGSIGLSGLPSNTQYTLNYRFNNVAQSPILINTNGSGAAFVTNLVAGAYTNFQLVNSFGCESGIFAGPITLTDPPLVPAPSGLVANPNPTCLGNVVTLSVTNDPMAQYVWSSSSANAGLNPANSNQVTMNPVIAGIYTISVVQIVSGCTSPAATVLVTINPLPDPLNESSFDQIDPTCGLSNGSISINGLTPNANFTIYYTKDNINQNLEVTTSGSGVAILSNLTSGTYSDFYLVDGNGCASSVYDGSLELFDPGLPDAPTGLMATPLQVCIRTLVSLSVDVVSGATYNWSASSPDAGLESSNSSEATLRPLKSGMYFISVTLTLQGCTSPPSIIEINVDGSCFNPDFNVTYTDVSITGDVSTNDAKFLSNTYGTPIVVPGNPSVCTPNISSDGSYTFVCGTPGVYQFLVPVCKDNLSSSCVNVPLVITVLETQVTNNPPIANHDYATTLMNTPIGINIIANDFCQSKPNCTLNSPTVVVNPTNGNFNLSSLTYTPNNGFVGRDSLRYRICQTPVVTPQNCKEAWVYIVVLPSDNTNITNGMDDYNQTPYNSVLNVPASNGLMANDTDPNGDEQTVSPQDLIIPDKGHILINPDGSYTFTPEQNFVGPLEIPYEVCDDNIVQACDSATLYLLVEPLNATGSIGNFVWHDLNGDGIQNSGESGMSGVTVSLLDMSGIVVASMVTNANGNYLFENILAGTYLVRFGLPSGYSFTSSKVGSNDDLDSDVVGLFGPGTTNWIELLSGQTRLNIDAGVYTCSTINGFVWYDINHNEVLDNFENGINGIRVNVYRNNGGVWQLIQYSFTGHRPNTPSGDGYFEFCVRPGEFYIEFETPPIGLVRVRANRGNNPNRDSDITNANGVGTTNTFNVNSGQQFLNVGAGFYPMAIVGNTVWLDENLNGIQDANETKVEGVVVEAFDAQTNQLVSTAITNEEGNYSLEYIEYQDIYLKFNLPQAYSDLTPTYPNVGDDRFNSDVDGSNGPLTTRSYTMLPAMTNNNIDLGLAFGILPLKWVDVYVTKSDNGHRVEWITTNEINVSHFEVERKIGVSNPFETIFTDIDSKGNLNIQNIYNVLDRGVQENGVYYYRIKQVDFDGKFSYSKTVKVESRDELDFELYPNPSKSQSILNLNLPEESVVSIELYDATSRFVSSITNTSTYYQGQQSFYINVDNLNAGVYNLMIKVNDRVYNKKLVKID